MVSRYYDPCVEYELCGHKMAIPLSHDLPMVLNEYPFYASNIARIAKMVKQAYPDLTFLDIGANIGDTVVMLRGESFFPVLCVEGEERFYRILERNVSMLRDVYLAKAFLGMESGILAGRMEVGSGSSRLASSNRALAAKSLPDLLREWPLFRRPKMIKIDTDGFDGWILRGAMPELVRARPVLFFEYDPHALVLQHDDGISVLRDLERIGYRKMMVYDNTGNYMISTDLSSHSQIRDLHGYFASWKSRRYGDLCLFHEEDLDLFHTVRESERIHPSRQGDA